MASQQGLPPGQRFKRSINYREEQKEAGIEAKKAERRHEASRLGRDAEKGVSGGGHAEVECKGKGKSKGKGEKRGGARTGRGGWELWRTKGERERYEAVFKRGAP